MGQSVLLKCRQIINVQIPEGTNTNSIGIARMSEGAILSDVFGYDNAPLFATQYKQWEQYANLGMSIKWTPSNVQANTNQYMLNPIQMWTDPNTYGNINLSEARVLQQTSYRQFDPKRGFKVRMSNR